MTLADVMKKDGELCACGKRHYGLIKSVLIEEGALLRIPALVREAGANSVFLIADLNTYEVAGERVENLLSDGGITVKKYIYPTREIFEPDEHAVGSVFLHYEPADMIIAVGTGVLNDIGKTVACKAGKPYMIVGTAPSMDGYASATTSMVRDGLKVTLPEKCPDFIVGDLDILAAAPIEMLRAGVGDMLAKYVSICEWRIGQLVRGEYYCETVANIVREAVRRIVKLAPRLLARDKEAVRAVMEGLVLSGVGANLAESTRVVSGGEHYCSHLWDMRFLAFGEKIYRHGIQCGVTTAEVVRIYEWLKSVKPSREKALNYVQSFDFAAYCDGLRDFVGEGSVSMIAREAVEKKYDPILHVERLECILAHWDGILEIIREEIPMAEAISALVVSGAPSCGRDLGKSADEMRKTFVYSKDIRYKYVLADLLFDLGILDEAVETVFGKE